MKQILKDYGTLVGPSIAFILGVIAIYIKFYSDRQLDKWKSKRKFKKLIELIHDSKPPAIYYSRKSQDAFLHADEARNLTNAAIFSKKLKVLISFISTIEGDVFTNCSVLEIQQFTDIKFIINYLSEDVEDYKEVMSQRNEDSEYRLSNETNKFSQIKVSYLRIIDVCKHPNKEFKYIE